MGCHVNQPQPSVTHPIPVGLEISGEATGDAGKPLH